MAFVCKEWCRAEVISRSNANRDFKVFFIDYGTTGYVSIECCRMLVEEYAMIPKQAIRGALYGVKPIRGCCLWSFATTESFIKHIRNKVHEIQIVKHHEQVSDQIWRKAELDLRLSRRISTSSCCSTTMD
jgi:hypothetical protein